MDKKVFLITSIEQYGKFVSYCIVNDISVWRLYWDDREKGDRCFHINWQDQRCYYVSKKFYEEEGFDVTTPLFVLNFGQYELIF